MHEDEICKRLLNGDPAALEFLVKAYGPCVYRLTARILGGTGCAADIEECCSEAFASAWQKRQQFDLSRGSLRTWILILARYRALDCRRRLQSQKGRETVLTGSWEAVWNQKAWRKQESPEEVLIGQESRREVAAALVSLSQGERAILYRRYYLEEGIDEIAASLGISRAAADTRLSRARKALKKRLDQPKKNEGKEVPVHE